MAIKQLTKKVLGKSKSGWVWDRKRELWFTYQIDTTFLGERYVRRGFRSEQEAKNHLKALDEQERLKEIGAIQILKFPRVKELFDRHRRQLATKKAQTTFDRVTEKFLLVLPSPNFTLDELRRKHFKDFCDLRVSEGIKAESANREITEISAAIHKAGDYFENLENWSVPGNLIYRPKFETAERDRVITVEERTLLIDYLLREKGKSEREKDYLARRRAGLVIYFGLLTGLRHGEISGLRKSDFDPKRRRLRAERFKTKKSGVRWTVFEPLTDTQLRVLLEADRLYPEGDFFFSAVGKNHNKIYSTLRAACKALGIPYGKDAVDGFVIHDTRHTFVTNLIQNGVDFATARSLSAHSADNMLMRYSHVTKDSRARAMRVIETEIGEGGSGEDELKRIYDQVKKGKMSFDEFKKALSDSFTVF